MKMGKFFLPVLILISTIGNVLLAGEYDYSDYFPPSRMPPGHIKVNNIPMFVNIGFDDNQYSSGVNWVLSLFDGKKNPAGNGIDETYDGKPARSCFYYATVYQMSTWNSAHNAGHGTNNHTQSHPDGSNYSVSQWQSEMSTCNSKLKSLMGISDSDIWGFRTPYLSWNNNTFTALKDMGFVYDCSLEGDGYDDDDGTKYWWPHTLDHGSPGNPDLGSYPGLWEVPVHTVLVPSDDRCAKYGLDYSLREKLRADKICGLDYNMWFEEFMTKSEFIAVLKYTLDQRLKGNRCPMAFGAHSDYYAPEGQNAPNATCDERRQAIREFVEYALTKPEVRIVPTRDIIRWMRNPVGLDGTAFVDTTNPSENLVTNVSKWSAQVDEYGSSINTDTSSGIVQNDIARVKFTIASADSNNDEWPWGGVTADFGAGNDLTGVDVIKITYKCGRDINVNLPQPPLDTLGASYAWTIPASPNNFNTEYVLIDHFLQPMWIPEEQVADLDLTKVLSLSFVPVLPYEGGSVTVEIEDLVIYNFDPTESVLTIGKQEIQSLLVGRVNAQRVSVTIPDAGRYTLALYTLDGKKVSTLAQRNFAKGSHSIAWNTSCIAYGIYLFRLQGNNREVVKRSYILPD